MKTGKYRPKICAECRLLKRTGTVCAARDMKWVCHDCQKKIEREEKKQ